MFPVRALRRDVPAWSETVWFGCWNEADSVGLFVHAGRYRDNLDLWWVQSVAYLPDGALAVDRSWAHSPDRWNLASNVFAVRGRPDGSASSTFRGAPERLSSEQLAQHAGGAGASVTMEWEVDLRLMRDRWVMEGHGEGWSDTHTQQHYLTAGTLSIDGNTFSLDGRGWGDHSSGPRNWEGFGGHILISVPFENDGLVGFAIRTPDGAAALTAGGVLAKDGAADAVMSIAGGRLENLLGAPQACELSVSTKSGRTLTWDVQVLHTFPATISELNDNVNGLDWRGPGNPLFTAECIARFTTSAGEVAYGHFERSVRRSKVDPHSFDVVAF